MGILDSLKGGEMMSPQGQSLAAPEQLSQGGQPEQGGDMSQMYQILMDNSMRAIADVAEARLREKGAIEGTADLVATAMVSNLQAANRNNKTIPPQVLLQVGKDIALTILKQMGVPEEQLDDVLIDVLLNALEKFGELSKGLLSAEEEQQYVQMINQINQAVQQMTAQEQGQHNPMTGGM